MSALTLSEFADRINAIMPVIAKIALRGKGGEFYKLKITMPQFVVLSVLNQLGESKMTDLARHMHATTAAMTGIVDRLVRDGYAVRISDPKDRRVVKVRLTNKGGRLVEKIMEHRRKTIMDMFSVISPEDRTTYLRILMKIRDNIKE